MTSDDGLVQLLIPAGAVDAMTTISVFESTDDAPVDALSPVYRLEPDGLQFARPVLLRIEGDAAPPGDTPTVALFNEDTSEWDFLDTMFNGNAAITTLEHFSRYVNLPGGPEPVVPFDNISVSPATRTSNLWNGTWQRWVATSTRVTVSGTVSPDGTGTAWGGSSDGSLTQEPFTISSGSFSFTYDVCARGSDLSLVGLGSSIQIDVDFVPGTTCAPPVIDAGPVDTDAGPADAGPPVDSGVLPLEPYYIDPLPGVDIGPDTVIDLRFPEGLGPLTLVLGGSLAGASDGGTFITASRLRDTLRIQPSTTWPLGAGTLTVSVENNIGTKQFSEALSFTVVTPGGDYDQSFDSDGFVSYDPGDAAEIRGMGIDSMGRIVVAGTLDPDGVGGVGARFMVARFTSSGALDGTFGNGGLFELDYSTSGRGSFMRDMVVASDDSIFFTGAAFNAAGDSGLDLLVVKLAPNGSLDSGWANAGIQMIEPNASVNSAAYGMALHIDANDQLLVVGRESPHQETPVFKVWRMGTNLGAFDNTFNGVGFVELTLADITLQNGCQLPDG